MTLPEIDETPTTSKVTVKFLGVNTTLNKLAVKLELSWHVFKDFDSISWMAETPESVESSERVKMKGESSMEDRMIASVY